MAVAVAVAVAAALLRADLKVLLASRLLSELGVATLTYGAMVHLARKGADQLEVTLLTTAGAAAALAFGLRGGLIADSSSKRVALALAYLLQAALCVVVPMLLGTDFLPLLLLVFSVHLLTQVVSPAVKSAVVLASSTAEIGIAVTLLMMAGGVGSGIGTAVLAPVSACWPTGSAPRRRSSWRRSSSSSSRSSAAGPFARPVRILSRGARAWSRPSPRRERERPEPTSTAPGPPATSAMSPTGSVRLNPP